MESKDLRLGNFLQGQDGQIHVVEFLNSYGGVEINEDGDDVFYEPIPLNEDWLVKFGFKNGRRLAGTGDDHNFYDIAIDTDDDKKPIWTFSQNNETLKRINYIHQLQNLYFALTGEELTMKKTG